MVKKSKNPEVKIKTNSGGTILKYKPKKELKCSDCGKTRLTNMTFRGILPVCKKCDDIKRAERTTDAILDIALKTTKEDIKRQAFIKFRYKDKLTIARYEIKDKQVGLKETYPEWYERLSNELGLRDSRDGCQLEGNQLKGVDKGTTLLKDGEASEMGIRGYLLDEIADNMPFRFKSEMTGRG